MQDKAKRVFISYAREDSDLAQKLHRDLRRVGVETWIDSQNLRPGEDWKRAIRRAIKESRFFLALISRHSVHKRGYVQNEIRYALEVLEELPPDQIYVIPVRLEECDPQFERIQSLNYLDLFRSYPDGLQRILQVVAADAAFSRDTVDPQTRKTKPSGELSLFKIIFDQRTDTTRSAIQKRLDLLLTSSAHGRRLVENLFLESHLGDEDWIELINTLEQTNCDVYTLLEAITAFSGTRILLGDEVEDYIEKSYFCFRSITSVALYMMNLSVLGFATSDSLTDQVAWMAVNEPKIFYRHLRPEARLGRNPMWSTFAIDGDLSSALSDDSLRAVALSLGLDNWFQNEMLLLFEYKLKDSNPPRLPTFCDLYSTGGWQLGESVTLPYAKYSWSVPTHASVSPLPEVVHKAVKVSDAKIRLLPKTA